MNTNQIQGSLPLDLGITMSCIETLAVADNQFTGPIPVSISNASNLVEFNVVENKLSGSLPSFEKLDKLSRFVIGVNLLGSMKSTDLNFLYTLNIASRLKFLLIGENNFGGVLPDCIGNLSSNLVTFKTQDSRILGRIPTGIENLINLELLAVSNNQLSGSIPLDIGRLQKLRTFYSPRNSLSGSIPPSFGNLTMLITLDLEDNNLHGNIPSSLGVTLVFSFLLIWCFRKKKEEPITTYAEKSLLNLSYRCLLEATVSSANLVGSGSFGSVYKGILEESGVVIVVKVLNLLCRGASRSFMAECETLKNIRHRNLVKVLTEISDFGLAKFITPDMQNKSSSLSSSLGLRGTIGYAPPEYGLGSIVTTYGDVYSYGILLLEMFTGKKPTDKMFNENLNLHSFVKTALQNQVVAVTDTVLLQGSFQGENMTNNSRNQRDNKLLQSLNSIFEIRVTCSVVLPTERMNMTDVVAKLSSIRDQLLPTRPLRSLG
ncbi:Serine-threonine protein kinase, plant-type, putative [Theobroma cacao]|uniref:Serine-threonine protein kinase, plant-type, putative n=1 Tax=Theobroma cacao TaxID=3641 RepID=A0A061FQQ3_THECC|nr:Serine-threonine protein kinase, plant-type, putative [Theobroma cacao]